MNKPLHEAKPQLPQHQLLLTHIILNNIPAVSTSMQQFSAPLPLLIILHVPNTKQPVLVAMAESPSPRSTLGLKRVFQKIKISNKCVGVGFFDCDVAPGNLEDLIQEKEECDVFIKKSKTERSGLM